MRQHGINLATPGEAAANAIPVVTSFVLTATDKRGGKSQLYGACIVWYEELPADVVHHFLDESEVKPAAKAAKAAKEAAAAAMAAEEAAEAAVAAATEAAEAAAVSAQKQSARAAAVAGEAAAAEAEETAAKTVETAAKAKATKQATAAAKAEETAAKAAEQAAAAAKVAEEEAKEGAAKEGTPPALKVHAPEAICLLSKVAVFDTLMECCRQLFRMRISSSEPLAPDALQALLSTPMPSSGRSCELPLGNVCVPVTMPADNQLPHTMAGRDFLLLFQALDVNSVIMLWALLLTEQKVVLQAKQPHVLTMAAETLSALLFPFSWQHVYIPILPRRMLEILQAPVPFIVGIDEENLRLAERRDMIPDDVVQVDLDENAIMSNPELAGQMHLPQKQYHKLYKAIAPFCRPPSADQNGGNAASAFPMAPPPDLVVEESVVKLSDMTEEAVSAAIETIKAAFLRFQVSLMANYQELMVVPPPEIKVPSATDFFNLKRWMARFSGSCTPWLCMFADTQSFTQFFEGRLRPQDVPALEVCFFNESIDAKLMRSARTRLFGKRSVPLLTTGEMPPNGYTGILVPPRVRTVYNASMIAARPVRSQQQVGLLFILGSGLQETYHEQVADFQSTVKQEFARNLVWSRVDIEAALLLHVCPWHSKGSEHHQRFKRALSTPAPCPFTPPVAMLHV